MPLSKLTFSSVTGAFDDHISSSNQDLEQLQTLLVGLHGMGSQHKPHFVEREAAN